MYTLFTFYNKDDYHETKVGPMFEYVSICKIYRRLLPGDIAIATPCRCVPIEGIAVRGVQRLVVDREADTIGVGARHTDFRAFIRDEIGVVGVSDKVGAAVGIHSVVYVASRCLCGRQGILKPSPVWVRRYPATGRWFTNSHQTIVFTPI